MATAQEETEPQARVSAEIDEEDEEDCGAGKAWGTVNLDTELARSVLANFGEAVEALDLRGAGVERVEGDLNALSSLAKLILADNCLTELSGLGELGELRHLDVSNNNMYVLFKATTWEVWGAPTRIAC